MKYSLNLGAYKGIRVQVHWTFLFLIAFIVFREVSKGSDLNTILVSIGFVLTVFLCVLLHEFGHALTAKKYGIETSRITLLPIGGVANLTKMPDKPSQEFWVAIAGPLVNVGIAIILYPFIPLEAFSEKAAAGEVQHITIQNFFVFLFMANTFLVIFNAIPAFPMDGGRIFRALLAMRMGRPKATRIAALLGQFVAVLFFFTGLFSNPFLILIAIFVFFGAYSENMMVQQMDLLRGYKVKDAMMTDITFLHPHDTVQDAVNKLLAGSQQNFIIKYEDDSIAGILTREQLINAVNQEKMDIKISNIMDKEYETLQADNKLRDVYNNLFSKKEIFFPVMENGKVAGILDRENLNEFLMIQAQLHY